MRKKGLTHLEVGLVVRVEGGVDLAQEDVDVRQLVQERGHRGGAVAGRRLLHAVLISAPS